MELALVLLLLVAVSAANGANDVCKGVATLAGSGLARYRTAILWGAFTTLAGSLASALVAGRMLKLFSSGILSVPPTTGVTLGVLTGTAGWVAVATATRLPVSTTHALIGSLLGAGAVFAPGAVAWSAVGPRLAAPLLLSIVAAYGLSLVFNQVLAWRTTVVLASAGPGGGLAVSAPAGDPDPNRGAALHWASSGAVGFARGLNDTPKLVGVGGVLASTQVGLPALFALVAAAMFAGSLLAGRRVTRVLAQGVVRMDHREGLCANLATGMLVIAGARLGLPMSTTQVSTGAIAGIAGVDQGRLNHATVRSLLLAWTVTPLVAGAIAASACLVLGRLLG